MTKKKILTFLSIVVLCILGYSIWYVNKYSMSIIDTQVISSKMAEHKILVASQGSDFKNVLLDSLLQRISSPDRYIKVTDATKASLEELNYDAYILIHTWEIYHPPACITFLLQQIDEHESVFSISTSGSGHLQLPEIDGISGASVLTNIEPMIDSTSTWLDKVLTAKQ